VPKIKIGPITNLQEKFLRLEDDKLTVGADFKNGRSACESIRVTEIQELHDFIDKRKREMVMKKHNAVRRGRLFFAAVFLLAGVTPWMLYAQTASPELIVDICSTPHKYWNKYVMIKGHVRSVTANPPGTNRGSYVLRDSSDVDITILTSDLPAQGRDYTVSGNVEQTSPDVKVPVIREFRRVSGSEAAQAPVPRIRRAAPPEEAAPVYRHEPAQPAAGPPPAAQTSAVPAREAPPVVVPPAPAAESSGISTSLLIGIIGLAAVIVIALIVIVLRPKRPAAPVRTSYAPPLATSTPPHIRPPTPPPSTANRAASASAPPRSVATQVVPPPAPKATEIYFDLGMDLVSTDGPDRGKRFPLTKPTTTLGRSGARQNDITLSDGTVSREHAKVIYSTTDKTFRLINESATNPARLNGNPIDAVGIKDGDTIQIGSTILKFGKRGQ
jgi:hypothetical protein